MNKRVHIYLMICGFATLFIAGGFLKGCCVPGPAESLAVTLHPQETRMWCWAASAQMVMDYLGHNVSQCVQANNRFGRTDCCNTPVPSACVNGGWPEFNKYGFDFKTTSWAPLSWQKLKEQISTAANCKKRPFCFTWKWNGSGGHVLVAVGYITVGGIDLVEILNPGPVNVGTHRWITYEAYVSGSNYTHWHDYYDIEYIGGQ